jgi:hypothetical protein
MNYGSQLGSNGEQTDRHNTEKENIILVERTCIN